MGKKSKNHSQNDYIEKMIELQEHQYDPGYYTGGNLHPLVTHTGRPEVLGWFWVISVPIYSVLLAYVFIRFFKIEDLFIIIMCAIIVFGLAVLQFVSGIRLIKKGGAKAVVRIRKKILTTCWSILIIVATIYLINITLLQRESSVAISNVKTIEISQSDNNYYLKLINEDVLLRCDYQDYDAIRESKHNDGTATFQIKYKFNILFPKSGKVTEFNRLN